jgi:hypothetical protein
MLMLVIQALFSLLILLNRIVQDKYRAPGMLRPAALAAAIFSIAVLKLTQICDVLSSLKEPVRKPSFSSDEA